MTTRNSRNLQAIDQSLADKADELLKIGQAAEGDDRELTDDENQAREDLRGEIVDLKERRETAARAVEIDAEIETLGRGLIGDRESKDLPKPPQSLGQQFVESENFKRTIDAGLTGKWSTGDVTLDGFAANFFEGTPTTPGPAGAAVAPDLRPGVVPILFQRLTVADLLASGVTNSNLVRYVEETVADGSATSSVAEGAAKPEVTLELDLIDEPVRKLAAFLPTSDEAMEDVAQLRSFLDARLSLFVRIEEEDQLLNKTGTGTDLNGLLNRVPAGNKNQTSSASAANAADHIFAAISKARDSFLEVDGIVINNDDWEGLRLLKDGNDNYIAGSPFSNAVGGQPTDYLWGKPVVVTAAMAAGTALVGAFKTAAQVYRKGSLTTEASNSHADFFQKNMTAIRAEERLALAVYRPEAFATADVGGS